MSMTDERSVDEYLGFAHKASSKEDAKPVVEPDEAPAHAGGAYEDSWYQVLKAKAEDDESD